jgi:hypothetical protein
LSSDKNPLNNILWSEESREESRIIKKRKKKVVSKDDSCLSPDENQLKSAIVIYKTDTAA